VDEEVVFLGLLLAWGLVLFTFMRRSRLGKKAASLCSRWLPLVWRRNQPEYVLGGEICCGFLTRPSFVSITPKALSTLQDFYLIHWSKISAVMRVSVEEAFSVLAKWRDEETPVECWLEGDVAAHMFGQVTRADNSIIQIRSERCRLCVVVPENAELEYGDHRAFQSSLRQDIAHSYEGLLCARLSSHSSLVVGEMRRVVQHEEGF
jgi:hypothetical protein